MNTMREYNNETVDCKTDFSSEFYRTTGTETDMDERLLFSNKSEFYSSCFYGNSNDKRNLNLTKEKKKIINLNIK
jgi:hypothetical protein